MTLISQHSSPLEDEWVALDLETTGLSAKEDEIIEIGAVRFHGERVIDTYSTFVDPHRKLSDFIKRYTGITQTEVDGAPPFSRVAGSLASFIGSSPVVGHNIAFDLGFLAEKGLRLPNARSDTWDIGYVLFPTLPSYSLGDLAAHLKVAHPRPHRALEDAQVTRDLFLKLMERLARVDHYSLAHMRRLSDRSPWLLSYVLTRLDGQQPRMEGDSSLVVTGEGGAWQPDISGLDMDELGQRLKRGRALRPDQSSRELDVDLAASLLASDGPLADSIPGFEERPQQIAMARAVAEAINDGTRLIVEAGTGVGKSMAYLLPALLYASVNNRRVVVSTNTINLQEQLLNKDVPALLEALSQVDGAAAGSLKFTQLKGRANYLCLKRWQQLCSSEALSDHEARLLAKTLVWLKTTNTGDRTELNLGHASSAAPWTRLSAQGATECPAPSGPCFLRAAREKAAESHLVIVNHALLLSDLTSGGSLIPPYDILIVDEAHHLEEEATRHLGFQLDQSRLDDHVQSLSDERGLLGQAVAAFRGSSAAITRQRSVEEVSAELNAILPRLREHIGGMFSTLEELLRTGSDGNTYAGAELRVTSGTRAQPAWSQLEILWQNVDLSLSEVGRSLDKLQLSLDGLEEAGLINYDGLLVELTNVQQANAELRQRLAEFIPQPKSDGIYWATRGGRGGELTLHAAPLSVGETLDSLLYSKKRSIVLTSATLSANDSFQHVSQRTGFADAQELLLGSPFDFPTAAMVCVPDDMPEPNAPAYQPAVEEAITEATLAVGGRAMALFTSHASLQATAAAVRGHLQANGITVLAQGVDGTPRQLVRRFLDDPKSVLLGTSSFWEGVDLAGEALKVLLVARLPFSVPTEPVFAARSELYENPFNEYALPQAILRLRQGFGRLIRSKSDKGVAVILDRRVLSRRYGKALLDSLPPVTLRTCPLRQLQDEIERWLGE